ncbi:hypothetical protein H8S95_15975 [Pontibacter sp. KCTC 32443]|uniref:hypothetical protein n=1 Tax=Pontibacter TaxID=323449 RepID=UPI00164D6755|nr:MULTISPECIES: hypothetical protein [Pontibacter]MBC5775575.1 hypothetical protein [Pontibacter sp. KCTC 32443]
MQKLFGFALLWILCSSCQSEDRVAEDAAAGQSIDSLEAVQEEPVREQTTDTLSFEAAFNRFFAALHAADTATINQYIYPTYGLWVIEQPGALPKMTRVTDISAFKREYQDRSFFTLREEMKACDLKEEVWPTFDCANMNYEAGKSGYSKDGCFVAGSAKFQKSGYWDYASLSEAEIKRIKAALPFVQKSVLHTATSFEFHFGFIDGRWQLLFTKLIYPCSA